MFVDIHSKDLIAILHLLVALATHYRAPICLPEKVSLKVREVFAFSEVESVNVYRKLLEVF